MNFGQLITAMVTPFNDKNEIDFPNVTNLIEHLLATGTEGIVVAGTTGESPTLTTEEKLQLFQHVVKIVDNRVPVIAGTGSNNTYESIELTKKAEAIGVNGIMLVTPYYNKPNQEGMYQHFKAIADATKLPVMLYNIPGRSAVGLTVETVVRLSKVSNIICIKEASGNLEIMSQMIEQTDDDFILYSGDDGITLPVLAIGGVGVVSVASHVIGTEMKEMITLFNSGKNKEAAGLHRSLLPVMKGLFTAPNPVPVKTALKITGMDVGSVRLPLVPLSVQEYDELNKTLEPIMKVTLN